MSKELLFNSKTNILEVLDKDMISSLYGSL